MGSRHASRNTARRNRILVIVLVAALIVGAYLLGMDTDHVHILIVHVRPVQPHTAHHPVFRVYVPVGTWDRVRHVLHVHHVHHVHHLAHLAKRNLTPF